MAVFTGDSGNNEIIGTTNDDQIDGLGGNDTVDGLDGNDEIDGGTGNDDIAGDDGNDSLVGGAGDDTVLGDAGNDLLDGNGGDDMIFGDTGDDTLRGFSGDDFLSGGEGVNLINPGSGQDFIEVGLGDDEINLVSRVVGEGFLTIGAHGGAGGMFALIDGEDNFGAIIVDNGPVDPEGVALFEGLNNALKLDPFKPDGGMSINGTDFDDNFLIDPGENGWIAIRPGEGSDTIQIEGDSGFVRLDYSDQSDSIFANLKFGLVVDGSDGFVVDRITGEGRVNELRGTDFDDIIFGSREDDRFILRRGDDEVFGGQGDDLVRYDRSGVGAVDVDLGSNTATGTWGGDAFTHSLNNIENIRGSRDDDDIIRGNAKGNLLEGRGGADQLVGRNGDDTLFGGDGADKLTGGGDNDVLVGNGGADKFYFRDGDGSDRILDFNDAGNDKISLAGVTEITDFADLLASHISEDVGNVVTTISDGAGWQVELDGILIADLGAGDFLF